LAGAIARSEIHEASRPRDRPTDARVFLEGLNWALSLVDAGKREIAVHAGKGRAGHQAVSLVQLRGRTVPAGLSLGALRVAPDASLAIDDRRAGLDELRPGMLVRIELSGDRMEVTAVRARSDGAVPPPFVQVIHEVDAAGRTLWFSLPESPPNPVQFPVAEGAAITGFYLTPESAIWTRHLELKELRTGVPVSLGLEIGAGGRPLITSVMCAPDQDNQEPLR
jgi:hypothetical protein